MILSVLMLTALLQGNTGFHVPFLYQRCMYVENLLVAGAWWANPASLGSITSPTLVSTNGLPLGNRYLISDTRFIVSLPDSLPIVMAAGIIGAGDYRGNRARSSVSQEGFGYSSHFAFERPRFQIGGALRLKAAGMVGLTLSGGFDVADQSSAGLKTLAFSPSLGAGWLSPPLAGMQISLSFLFMRHTVASSFWESGAKIGLLYCSPDSMITGTVHYSLSLTDGGAGIATPQRSTYDAATAMVSIRIAGPLAVCVGISRDVPYAYANGTCLHAGAEIRRKTQNPFFGVYDIGWRVGYDLTILHRIGVGIDLRGLSALRRNGD